MQSADFWHFRLLGRLDDAKRALFELEKTANPTDESQMAGLALMRNSLKRSAQGGLEAEQEISELEKTGLFARHPSFFFFYNSAMNMFAQGRYNEALERVLSSQSWCLSTRDKILAESTRVICLQNLNFDTKEPLTRLKQLLTEAEGDVAPEVLTQIGYSYAGAALRENFRTGKISEALAYDTPGWSQIKYTCGWLASLPYVVADRKVVETSLSELSRDPNFYLRNYRLQTLVGRVYGADARVQTSWLDRASRLYLWTWRWLVDPSIFHQEALITILGEFEAWSGNDVLAYDDQQEIQMALEWFLIFEPQYRARLSALLKRTALPINTPLFALERLWMNWVRAKIAGSIADAKTAEAEIARHPLAKSTELCFADVCTGLVRKSAAPSQALITIDTDSGLIYEGAKLLVSSQSLARLIAALVTDSKLTFADAMQLAFEIAPYDSGIHDTKIQNLVMRARKIVGDGFKIVTKGGWIFVDGDLSAVQEKFQVGRPSTRPRVALAAKQAQAPGENDRVRNEKSLSLLLKQTTALRGRTFTRAELEDELNIPKASLNRYLRVWVDRGWVEKTGSGPSVSYRITFFES